MKHQISRINPQVERWLKSTAFYPLVQELTKHQWKYRGCPLPPPVDMQLIGGRYQLVQTRFRHCQLP